MKSLFKKKLILIFTRDFNLWTNEHVRNQYVNIFPHIWGKGLKDQITHYTGRTFEWIRYEKDFEKLTKYMVNKDLDDKIFDPKTYTKYDQDVNLLRMMLKIAPKDINDNKTHLRDITTTFEKMYPYYGLCVFYPGIWRDKFKAKHGDKADQILNRLMHSRKLSEGLLKENDIYFREWLGPILNDHNISSNMVKLMTVHEIENLVKNIPPNVAELGMRNNGFIHIEGNVVICEDFNQYLDDNGFELEDLSETKEKKFKGQVAYKKGGKILGTVQTVFNQQEVAGFKKSRILVTPMTSPEFLPALKKASAIVTDEGGITCHAAINARELKKPCIIGTKIATKVLQDGDTVEVDTNKGTVTKK